MRDVALKVRAVVLKLYRFLFAREGFYQINRLLHECSLSGLGILNYENSRISGESSFIRRFFRTRQNDIVLDVGANVGGYSKLILASNPHASVYAFEPHPRTYKALSDNLYGLKVETYNVAAGECDGALTLYDYEENDGSEHASLYKDTIEYLRHAKAVAHEVKVINLDNFLQEKNIERVSLLKIDTEGHELAVLKGAKHYISCGKIRAIHFEFNDSNVSSRTYFRDFWDFLPNYTLYRLLPNGMVKIKSYEPIFCEIFAYQNVVAILNNSHDFSSK